MRNEVVTISGSPTWRTNQENSLADASLLRRNFVEIEVGCRSRPPSATGSVLRKRIQHNMYTEQKDINRDPHDVNKGLNVKHYMLAVLVAIVALLVGAALFVGRGRTGIVPHATDVKPTTAASPQ